MYSSLFNVGLGRIFLSKFKYRDRATIISDILDAIYRDPKGKTKTSLMRATNLNFDQANKYLNFLMLCDIVKAADPLGSQEVARYRLTEKGIYLLRNFDLWHLVLETARQRVL
ncbi:MAG: winged helix-turn-helix domain-containing protein [Candidatus Bathyarchaeia archaeon]